MRLLIIIIKVGTIQNILKKTYFIKIRNRRFLSSINMTDYDVPLLRFLFNSRLSSGLRLSRCFYRRAELRFTKSITITKPLQPFASELPDRLFLLRRVAATEIASTRRRTNPTGSKILAAQKSLTRFNKICKQSLLFLSPLQHLLSGTFLVPSKL